MTDNALYLVGDLAAQKARGSLLLGANISSLASIFQPGAVLGRNYLVLDYSILGGSLPIYGPSGELLGAVGASGAPSDVGDQKVRMTQSRFESVSNLGVLLDFGPEL
jgi:uncharacterized protein GlcG (DUF336 family)